jgi:hypothetical protein
MHTIDVEKSGFIHIIFAEKLTSDRQTYKKIGPWPLPSTFFMHCMPHR